MFEIEVPVKKFKQGKCEGCYQMKEKLYFPCVCEKAWYCSKKCKQSDWNFHERDCSPANRQVETIRMSANSKYGLVGLRNLGNTCFMNTSLQCLSQCTELVDYFLQDHYKKDINEVNPIGKKGAVAMAFAELVNNLWYGTRSDYSPTYFKREIGNFQSMFSGFGQHDTQELLGYLLDALHEDLNRVLEKPIVASDDETDPDDIQSELEWNKHLMRNQSIVNDLFFGQFKSRVECPVENCKKVSVTFNAFMTLSLAMGKVKRASPVSVSFVFFDRSITPIKLHFRLNSQTTIHALRMRIADLLDINPYSFILVKTDYSNDVDCIAAGSDKLETFESYSKDVKLRAHQIDPAVFCSEDNEVYREDPRNTDRDYRNTLDEVKKAKDTVSKVNSPEYQDPVKETVKQVCFYSHLSSKFMGRTEETVVEMDVDSNHGFDQSMMPTEVKFTHLDYKNAIHRRKIGLPGVIYVNKEWTYTELHKEIFKMINQLIPEFQGKTFEEVFEDYNKDLDQSSSEQSNTVPYRLRLLNFNKMRGSACIYCSKRDCNNCIIPLSSSVKLAEYIKKVPTRKGYELDNTYNYLDTFSKRKTENLNFTLEVSFNHGYEKPLSKLAVYCEPYDLTQVSSTGSQKDLLEFLEKFSAEEVLDEQNMWYCNKCKEFRQAKMKCSIFKSPDILVIHLKRFNSSRKLETFVDFPLKDLDMSKYVNTKETGKSLKYDLFGVANHYGGSFGGHYTAYAYNSHHKGWYCFDDSSVYPMNESDVVKSSAYVLFYRRQGLRKEEVEGLYRKKFEKY